MHKNCLQLIYVSRKDKVELPLEDWQYSAIAQLLGLSIQEDGNEMAVSYFPKDFVLSRIRKMGILLPADEI